MQVLQAGLHKLIYLELEPDMVSSVAKQAGFDTKAKDSQRAIQIDLTAPGRQAPLLLFDAADPANLGWFSRCQFYVDGRSGAVMQTPIHLANKRDRSGHASRNAVRLVISKELPANFRLPGKAAAHRAGVLCPAADFPERSDPDRRRRLRRRRSGTFGRAHGKYRAA